MIFIFVWASLEYVCFLLPIFQLKIFVMLESTFLNMWSKKEQNIK